jgi:putative component of membrane protein insertase Oxa1/YidC/SpoIIIJ protein YidD
MVQASSLALIGLYQRYVSPHKGYCCAYRAHTGGRSCSSYARRAISRAGLWSGLILFRRRLRACAAAAMTLADTQKESDAKKGFFGECTPAVQEGKKLCCGSIIGGLQSQDSRTS